MDDEGINELPAGHSGELWCKTPTMMKGYWGRLKETREVINYYGWLV